MESLKSQFLARIQAGFQRRSIASASQWAEMYRVVGHPFPGRWTWEHHPWLREMHDSKAEKNVGQKAAQMGYTELVLNLTFYTMDVERKDVLYLLPNTSPDCTRFSAGRFNSAVEMSDYLSKVFTDVNNVGHKKAGLANVYINGMNSRSGLKGLPVTGLVFDELDEMPDENITLAEARSDGQLVKWDWKISTPTIPLVGINKYYLESTQERFFFKCPCCSRQTEFRYPESLVVLGDHVLDPELKKSHYICYQCKGVLEHLDKPKFLKNGYWVPHAKNTDVRGFHVSQMYSSASGGKPEALARKVIKARANATDEQELHNSNLGSPFIVADAKITDTDLEKCIKEHVTVDHAKGTDVITMGVDVGKVCHVEIDDWYFTGKYVGDEINMNAVPKVVWFGTCDFPELVKLMHNFQVKAAVIDALPETRMSEEFARKFPGFVQLCYYNHHVKAKNIVSAGNSVITVNRTSWLDLSLGRFRRETILLPRNIDREYREHVKAQVRKPSRNQHGEAVAQYITPPGVADHYGHARNYAEIALPLAMGYGPSQNITKAVN